MTLVEITQEDFQKLSEKEGTYHQNGVIFCSVTNNVLAFFIEDTDYMDYESPFKYFKVVREKK
jgi:hypothetical protein